MNSKILDQYYTNSSIAEICFQNILENITNINEYFLIEPSAGTGSFSNIFLKNNYEFLAIDIDPKQDYILKNDFLTMDLESLLNNKKIITIGNPPFGKNSSLAIKFFNRSAEYSEYICFILPKTFKKTSVMNRLNFYMVLIYEKELNKNSFVFNENEYDVPCVFQIWKKTEIKREKIILENKSKYFDFCNKNKAEYAIRRVGGLSGKLIKDFLSYKEPSHYYIKINKDKIQEEEFVKIFNNSYLKFNTIAKNTSGNPSLSKGELISIIDKEIINFIN